MHFASPVPGFSSVLLIELEFHGERVTDTGRQPSLQVPFPFGPVPMDKCVNLCTLTELRTWRRGISVANADHQYSEYADYFLQRSYAIIEIIFIKYR